MNDGLIPRRYAKALLKFAIERGAEKRIYDLTQTLASSFAANRGLEPTLANPFIPVAQKIELLKTAAGATDSDTVYADFLKLLQKNNRLDIARMIALAYGEDYRKVNDIYQVEVSSAAPLGPDQEQRLRSVVQSHLGGGRMEYSFRINPELIGGFTVKIGSEMLDASVKTQLEQIRLALLG